jgi:hypothetical protein
MTSSLAQPIRSNEIFLFRRPVAATMKSSLSLVRATLPVRSLVHARSLTTQAGGVQARQLNENFNLHRNLLSLSYIYVVYIIVLKIIF